MKLGLDAFRRSRRPATAGVERFIATNSFPLVDPGGVTFVWHGDADVVRLRTFVFGLPDALPLERVGVTALWALRVEMPAGSRIEYKFEIVKGTSVQWVTDPLNPDQARDPFGANSVCGAHGYERPGWSIHNPAVRSGTIETVSVPANEHYAQAEVRVWLPARFRRTRRYPLLVVHDGGDFQRYADLDAVLANLTASFEIPDMIVALHEPQQRNSEYVVNAAHAHWLSETLVPTLEHEYPLERGHGLLGASLGAVAALHTAWSYPQTWTRLALLSGSFAFSDLGPHQRPALFDPIVRFINEFREAPAPLAASWYITCGRYESLINENRAMSSLLAGLDVDLRFDEVADGHHWQGWRDRMQNALGWLYPGPRWMVYN